MRTRLVATAVAVAALAASIATGFGLSAADAAPKKHERLVVRQAVAQPKPAKAKRTKPARPVASSCTRTRDTVRVVSLNVKSNPTMSAAKVRHDVHRAAGAVVGVAVVGQRRVRARRVVPGVGPHDTEVAGAERTRAADRVGGDPRS